MRSLFTKILLWFVATSMISFFGAVVISALDMNPWQSPFGRLMEIQEKAARNAFETGGLDSLANFERRFRASSDMSAVLTDARGRDLLTGRDYSASLKNSHFPMSGFHPRNGIIPHRSSDGKYNFVLIMPASRYGSWFFSPQGLYGLAVAVLLCYLLAMSLTSPLRKLQKTLERFGQGDLTARTGSKRRDELGQLSRTFDRMAGRIETLLAAERRLLLDISHEIRSPLARLGVVVELARNSEDVEGSLNRIQKEADRLNDLVGQLLQVTRAEGDRDKLLRDAVRLDELLETVVEDCTIEAEARNCELHLGETPNVTVSGDPELLRRAIENIIRNAIRYSPQGERVDIALGTALNDRGSAARITVRDHGPGVPPESLGRIFDPFYRVDPDRSRTGGGVGLGLAIARRAVELHDGALHASNANPGLLVEIEIPRQPAEARETVKHGSNRA
jgi:two-component system sensor histidine kinase CpxA